jgi:hypothetical protein
MHERGKQCIKIDGRNAWRKYLLDLICSHKWDDYIKMALKEAGLKDMHWINLAEDKDFWWVFIKPGDLLDYLRKL